MIKIPEKELFLSKLLSSDVKKAKLVAVAFRSNGNIICSAVNRGYWGCKDKFTIHAEEFLIKKLNKIKTRERNDDINVLVARWSVEKQWTKAHPCKKCLKALLDYGVKNILYTDETGAVVWMEHS